MNRRSEDSLTVDNSARRWTSEVIRSRYRRKSFRQYHAMIAERRFVTGQMIIFDMLPDDVLLEIFNFYVIQGFRLREKQRIEEWIPLAHVCRRWRNVVLQSPCHLNLRLLCTPQTPARDILDIWPPLPLIICDVDHILDDGPSSVDNIIAALEHNDRVCQIKLNFFTSSELEYVMDSVADKPFPELTDLHLGIFKDDRPGPILLDSFLGGTAPRLQSIHLEDVSFPGLPKLLLSTTHLAELDLHRIPHSGYISPEAMATSLSALRKLRFFRLHFRYPRPRPALDSRRPRLRPPTRYILPDLTEIRFKGASEYLEEILARIDTPRLNNLNITFFNQIIFDSPQLFQFVRRGPTLRTPEKCHIAFSSKAIIVKFPSQTSIFGGLSVEIQCTAPEWQLSSLEQVCILFLPSVSALENLYIDEDPERPPSWQDDIENTLWLDFLRSFVAVKNLYVSEEFLPRIGPALQELVGGRMTEVLPNLENIFLQGFQQWIPLHKGIEKFVAARQLTSHPVAVSRWGRRIL